MPERVRAGTGLRESDARQLRTLLDRLLVGIDAAR